MEDFIAQLDPKTKLKIDRSLDRLKEEGPNLHRPYADVVVGKIRELRIRFASDQIRILYFFFLKDKIVMLHGFRKKTSEIPFREIAQAERNMIDYMNRYEKGEV